MSTELGEKLSFVAFPLKRCWLRSRRIPLFPSLLHSSVHQAKGPEYDRVHIDPDIAASRPRMKPFKIGDRVRTAHGEGTIIELKEEKYLVALDGQAGRLWEKEWGLKKV